MATRKCPVNSFLHVHILSIIIKMLDTCKSPIISSGEEVRKDTKHAPDLLEGPDVNDEGEFDTALANIITF